MQAQKVLINQINQNFLNPNELSLEQLDKLRENIQRTNQYPSLVVLKRDNGYLLLDGHSRHQVLKELGHKEVWCEVWDLTEKDANLVLATLNSLHGIDDIGKRSRLIAELYQNFEEEIEILAKLLPESEKSMSTYLKISADDINNISEDLRRELIEDRLSLVIESDDAKRLAKSYEPKKERLRISFVFEEESDYVKALKYFGRNPDVNKLMKLIIL